jgi:hypothetical protein
VAGGDSAPLQSYDRLTQRERLRKHANPGSESMGSMTNSDLVPNGKQT